MRLSTSLVPLAAMLATACASKAEQPAAAPAAPPPAAYAQLLDKDGATKGRAVLTEAKGGVDVGLVLEGWPSGTYAFHVHAIGLCTPPDFTSAGPHFNPTGAKHGHHKGDLPNVTVGTGGTGRIEARIDGATLYSGETPVLDTDGAAVVVHAKPDDGVTDPAGNAGPRLACGAVVTK